MELDLLPGLCRVGYAPVALVMDAGDAFLRLEALDHREAREHVLEHAGVALLSVGDLLLRLGRPVAQDDGDHDGQQGEADGDQGQQRAVPQHQPQGAHEGDGHLDDVLQHPDVVLLDGVGVVAEGGKIPGAVLAGEGLDALFEEPVEGVFPVLPHGFCPERGEERAIQHPGEPHQREAHDRHQQERAEADVRVAGDEIGYPLQGPGDHQTRRGRA